MKLLFALCTMLLFAACNSRPVPPAAGTDSTDTTPTGPAQVVVPVAVTYHTDSLLQYYISHSSNPLIRQALQAGIMEEYFLDDLVDTDTASYQVYQVGHTVTDDSGANPRFVTDQWVYIDSNARVLYEYDLAGDKLLRWAGQ